jgi:Ni,Fe-hydrogenase maturation factor
MKKSIVFAFGSSIIPEDKIAWDIANYIKNNKLIEDLKWFITDNPEDLLSASGENIFILDVVKGINRVCIIEDIAKLEENKINTLHDFSLGFYLKLLKEIKKIKNFIIVGVPYHSKESLDKLAREVTSILHKYRKY